MLKKRWYASLKFGQGNPSVYTNNLDCYSIACDKNSNITVSNDRIYLTEEQRDPTGGVQTLFCMYGNPDLIRNQAKSFSYDEIEVLVQEAHNNNLEQASVIFTIKPEAVEGNKPQIICEYVINNNASIEKAGYSWRPFEDEEPKEVPFIGKDENLI